MYNKAILIGRLTAEPELKTTQSGLSVCSFTIACDRRFTPKGGERQADFINIVAWRQSAEFVCKYFHKGSAIGVEGSIQTRNYEDRNGNKRTAVEVAAEQVFFVESKASAARSGNSTGSVPQEEFEELADDLPFRQRDRKGVVN